MFSRFRYALLSFCLFAVGSLPGAEEAGPADSPPRKNAPQSADPNGNPAGASLRDAFHASVEEYRKSATEPNAKKMAEHYKRLTPAPALPEEADFHAAKGAAFAKLAKVPADFERAAKEFLEAVNLAPWNSVFHFNHAVCLKSAGKFAQALVSLKMAHLLARDDTERRDASTMRAEIEASQEMAANEAAGAAKKVKDANDAVARLAGMWVEVDRKCDPADWQRLAAAVKPNEWRHRFKLKGEDVALFFPERGTPNGKLMTHTAEDTWNLYSGSRLNNEWKWSFKSRGTPYQGGKYPDMVRPVEIEFLEQGHVIRTKRFFYLIDAPENYEMIEKVYKSQGYLVSPGPKGYVLLENSVMFIRIGD